MSKLSPEFRCKDVAPLLVFYVCDEVNESEHKQVEEHLSECSSCAAQLAEELRFSHTISTAQQSADEFDSAGVLLSQCRSELAEALDDLSAPPVEVRWQPFGWIRHWMALRPAWTAALLVFFGAALGTQILPWLQSSGINNGHAVDVMAAPKITDDQLSKMAVAGVNFSPASGSDPNSSSGTVRLQLSAEQPMLLSGNVDDPDVRRVLTYIIANGDQTHADVRLDCLEALKARARDLQVRRALLVAARADQNPAVRMKALEALSASTTDDAVRDALLDILAHDSNPGVRVEAVNLLVRSLDHNASDSSGEMEMPGISNVPVAPEATSLPTDSSTQRVVRALEDLQHRDPSRYVRLRSAAALREIDPGEIH